MADYKDKTVKTSDNIHDNDHDFVIKDVKIEMAVLM